MLLLLSHFSRVLLCATPQTAAHQAPPSLGFSRQEHWSGLPFPSPMRESEVTQSYPTLSDPMDCSLSGSSIHGIFQARGLEWGAIDFSVRCYEAHKKEFRIQLKLHSGVRARCILTDIIILHNTKGMKEILCFQLFLIGDVLALWLNGKWLSRLRPQTEISVSVVKVYLLTCCACFCYLWILCPHSLQKNSEMSLRKLLFCFYLIPAIANNKTMALLLRNL